MTLSGWVFVEDFTTCLLVGLIEPPSEHDQLLPLPLDGVNLSDDDRIGT